MADLEFPALPGWTEYAAAVQRYSDLVAERREHATVLDALERGEDAARRADDAAQAAALLAGAKDPGRKHHTRWESDLKAARNHARVLESATTQQAQAVLAMLTGDPDRAAQVAADAAEAARLTYVGMLDGLLAARDAYWRARAVAGWVRDGLTEGRRYKPTGAPPSLTDTGRYRPGATPADPVNAQRALAGFRAEVGPEPEPSPVAGYRVQREVDVRGVDDWTRGTRSAIDSVTYRPVPVDAQGRPVVLEDR